MIREKRWKLKDTEEIATELLNDQVFSQLLRKAVRFYPDPAAPDDTNIFRRKTGIPFAGNTGGDLKTRLSMIRQRLKPRPENAPVEEQQAVITVDESCTMLIWEMEEGYRWPEHKSEIRNEDENPLDKDNHGPEALGRFIRGYYTVTDSKESGSRQTSARVGRR